MSRLAAILEAGRRDFLDAASGVADARRRPNRLAWNALEIIEHVVIVEDRYLGWLTSQSSAADLPQTPPRRDADRELRLFLTIRNRDRKAVSPDALHPQGRYTELTEAVAGFASVRDRSVALAEDLGDSIYDAVVRHPYFGVLNGGELMQLIDGHARRHADQIREIADA